MNRERRSFFGRRLTRAATSLVPRTADPSLPADNPRLSSEEGVRGQGQTKDRMEALGFIICRLDELRQMAAAHGLEALGCLLDVAFTESCDAIRRDRSCAQGEESTR